MDLSGTRTKTQKTRNESLLRTTLMHAESAGNESLAPFLHQVCGRACTHAWHINSDIDHGAIFQIKVVPKGLSNDWNLKGETKKE